MPHTDEKATDVQEADVKVSAAPKGDNATNVKIVKKRNVWLIWVVIGGIVLLAIVAGGAAMAARAVVLAGQPPRLTTTNRTFGAGRPRFSNQRDFSVQQSNSDGLTTTTTTTNYTQTDGVVTKVGSDSITVAGSGKSQTITTNSSTTYVGGTKPAVNDSVVVIGTESDSTITATQVQVLN